MIELPTKITDYIDQLGDAALARLLTQRLVGGGSLVYRDGEPGCLVQVAENAKFVIGKCGGPWMAFDRLCRPAGLEVRHDAEVGAAIRDYICELRTNRELSSVREMSVG